MLVKTARPQTAPDFLLSLPSGSVRTQGCQAQFASIPAAQAELSRRAKQAAATGTPLAEEMIVGAIPFLAEQPAAFVVPQTIVREPAGLKPPAFFLEQQMPAATVKTLTSATAHAEVVAKALTRLEDPHDPLAKVVLARAVEIAFAEPVDPLTIAARLINLSNNHHGFIADLSPAGPEYQGKWLVGSSPEILIKKQGLKVSAFPLAGSAPRQLADPVADQQAGNSLQQSSKDLAEHQFVTAWLAEKLAPLCTEFVCPQQPVLTATNEMWHLATPISGVLADPRITALDLAAAVHPTPAVCGTPAQAAADFIVAHELTPRGFYAGAVGWCDGNGDGEFLVAIRCAEIASDHCSVRAYAGGGIVAGSNPAAEAAETTAKLGTIARALGVEITG